MNTPSRDPFTKAKSHACYLACSQRSSISDWSATPSFTSPIFWKMLNQRTMILSAQRLRTASSLQPKAENVKSVADVKNAAAKNAADVDAADAEAEAAVTADAIREDAGRSSIVRRKLPKRPRARSSRKKSQPNRMATWMTRCPRANYKLQEKRVNSNPASV